MSELCIKVEGYPEKAQRIADAIDEALPGMLAWALSQDSTDDVVTKLEGYEVPSMPRRMSQLRAA